MHERSLLGPADVDDLSLTVLVATALGVDPCESRVISSCAEAFPYDLPAITTAGRYWVSGEVLVAGETRAYRVFVKHVQCWSRSPLFVHVPEEHRQRAAASVPWRTEPLAYRSDLGDRLPEGLQMPRALGVFDLDDLSAAIWLAEVAVRPEAWTLETYVEAAGLLGRLAASPRTNELATVGRFDFTPRDYLEGRLGMQVLPMLREEGIWRHPLVAAAYDDDLRTRMLAAADRAEALVEELMTVPQLVSHGDACPNNLLRPLDGDGFVLIDYGFWGRMSVGFDLAQLLVGDVQIGRRSADDLAEVEAAIAPAYVEGLRAEGCQIPADVVRRAHALQLMIFTGLSSLPWEHLDGPPTPDLAELARQRAAVSRFSLDLLEATD